MLLPGRESLLYLIENVIVLFVGQNCDDRVSRHEPVAAEYVSLPAIYN